MVFASVVVAIVSGSRFVVPISSVKCVVPAAVDDVRSNDSE